MEGTEAFPLHSKNKYLGQVHHLFAINVYSKYNA